MPTHANDWRASQGHDRLTQEDHVGVLRSWHERFGADVRYLDTAALGLVVAKPPTNRREVARVAVEQYAYCETSTSSSASPTTLPNCKYPPAAGASGGTSGSSATLNPDPTATALDKS